MSSSFIRRRLSNALSWVSKGRPVSSCHLSVSHVGSHVFFSCDLCCSHCCSSLLSRRSNFLFNWTSFWLQVAAPVPPLTPVPQDALHVPRYRWLPPFSQHRNIPVAVGGR